MARDNPTAVKVEIAKLKARPSGQQEPSKPYQSGSAISFLVLMTNTSSENLLVLIYDPYYQSRPQLTKNGEVVPYRKDIAEVVERWEAKERERNVAFLQSLPLTRTLEPGNRTEVGILDLRDWYDPLKPGHYVLTTRYRFDIAGEWTDTSQPIEFDVAARPAPSAIPPGLRIELIPDAFQNKPKEEVYRLDENRYITGRRHLLSQPPA